VWQTMNIIAARCRASGAGRAGSAASATGVKLNIREREKKILDEILGPTNYDRRIRPSGINSTGWFTGSIRRPLSG